MPRFTELPELPEGNADPEALVAVVDPDDGETKHARVSQIRGSGGATPGGEPGEVLYHGPSGTIAASPRVTFDEEGYPTIEGPTIEGPSINEPVITGEILIESSTPGRYYRLVTGSVGASDRLLSFPAITANDQVLFRDAPATVIAKTISASSNTIEGLDDENFAEDAEIAGSRIQPASSSNPGAMSAADKAKLDNIQRQGQSINIAALEIDWSAGGIYRKTISANSTFTFANATDGMSITVRVTATGAYGVNWPASVKWPNDTPPAQTANGTTVYTFICDDTAIYGAAVTGYS